MNTAPWLGLVTVLGVGWALTVRGAPWRARISWAVEWTIFSIAAFGLLEGDYARSAAFFCVLILGKMYDIERRLDSLESQVHDTDHLL